VAKTRRAVFKFDERSLVSVDRLKEQGAYMMLDKSFPLAGVPVDTTDGRRCETCSLWQVGVSSPWHPDRNRCACPVPASVKKATTYAGYTKADEGETCMFWHPKPSQNEQQEHS